MFCNNCGSLLNENDAICPNCHAINSTTTTVDVNTNNKYQEYKESEENLKRYDFNKWLIYSILELVCCFQIFGIIAVILLFTQLKPAVERKNFDEADKARDLVKTILIIGLVIGIILNLLSVGLQILPVILAVVTEL